MDIEAADREASGWMRQGIALVQAGTVQAADEAVVCFDRAIELRRRIVAAGRPEFAFGLATGWVNRGEALLQRTDRPSVMTALGNFDEGIRLFRALPWQVDTEIRRRLAVAWQNRGLALKALGDRPPDEVRSAYDHALALLDDPRADGVPDRTRLIAAIWTNLAGVLIEGPDPDAPRRARSAALAALEHLRSSSAEDDVTVAELAIVARYQLCRALAVPLGDAVAATESTEALHLATDAVDEGLALARHWERKGVDRFRDIAAGLLRFGCRVYALHQPQFLDELVAENLDPAESSGGYVGSGQMRLARLEGLWLSLAVRRAGRP